MSPSLRIAVLWRPGRNVEMQRAFTGEDIPDDALEEAILLRDGLTAAGHEACLVRWEPDPAETLAELRVLASQLVFNVSSDKEAALLHAAGIPYCGSGIGLIALDKAARKKIMLHDGVLTPPFVVVVPDGKAKGSEVSVSDIGRGWEPEPPMEYPLFVKPVEGRGSAGVSDDSIVTNRRELHRQVQAITGQLGQGALVENYIQGREVTVGIIGDPPVVLEPLEIEYRSAKTNSFEHKQDREIMHCPARVSHEERERVIKEALRAFEVLGARDFARVDTILAHDGRPWVLELNTFAGLHMVTGKERHLHASYIGAMAKAMGLSAAEILSRIVDSAQKRYQI